MKSLKIALVLSVLALTLFGCKSEKELKESNFVRTYEYICVDGKQYLYLRGLGYASGITIVLDDNGKPIKCQ